MGCWGRRQMVRGEIHAPDPQGSAVYEAVEGSGLRTSVAHIRSLSGSVVARRHTGAIVELKISDPVFAGDVIETGAGGRVALAFRDGTALSLAPLSSVVLENADGSDASLSATQVSISKGTFAIRAGRRGDAAGLSINSPFGLIRGIEGGAMLTLSDATFMFVLIKELHAEARDVGFLIDDIVNYKDL